MFILGDTPNPFSPKSEMLAFLERCEKLKDQDKNGQIAMAMARVRRYLASKDKADSAKTNQSPR
jgi:hypothetical protein